MPLPRVGTAISATVPSRLSVTVVPGRNRSDLSVCARSAAIAAAVAPDPTSSASTTTVAVTPSEGKTALTLL